ncbi:MAG: molybdopterin cofactor-binding domain-containing protein, partial [Flammeovirgaceae bacterium]
MKNIDSNGHVTGRSIYVDDIPTLKGTLYGAVVGAEIAHGLIDQIDFSAAKAYPGVVEILTAKHIIGENQIGGIIPDEPLFADRAVHFQGQPIALIIAETEAIAQKARKLVNISYTKKKVITDPREAHKYTQFTCEPRTFNLGDVNHAWEQCAYVFEGKADSNGQEHLYIETQGAYAVPQENGNLKLYSSTQGPTAVQRTAARVLGVPMHRIEVDVNRLGGGFGGKEDQATPWAVMAALGVQVVNKPIKLVLHRMDDMKMTGKRHPYSSDYKIGLSADLKILAYEVTFYQNAGAAADLSPAVMERTLFHCTNAYFIPHVQATAFSCKTNLPPNTAFRGFGGPQGMFVMESAIAHAAHELGVMPYEIQQKNLIHDGDEFPYGQLVAGAEAKHTWEVLNQKFPINQAFEAVNQFNQTHQQVKKGISLMPICFGISFTKTP